MIDRNKNKYQQHIAEYDKRWNIYREKYNVVRGRKSPDEYKKAVANIERKIRIWKGQLRRIRKREEEVERIRMKIIEFSSVDVKNSIVLRGNRIYRHIFYKYALENGINSKIASTYVGATNRSVATLGRRRFTRSFDKNPQNYELWRRFLIFVEEEENEKKES